MTKKKSKQAEDGNRFTVHLSEKETRLMKKIGKEGGSSAKRLNEAGYFFELKSLDLKGIARKEKKAVKTDPLFYTLTELGWENYKLGFSDKLKKCKTKSVVK